MALYHGAQALTYRQLCRRSDQLAAYLQRCGVGLETRVALLLPRGIDMVVSIVAVLKAGGAYIPLDAGYPLQRLSAVIAVADPPLLLTCRALAEQARALGAAGRQVIAVDELLLPPDRPQRRAAVSGDSLAYVMFTSGSSGTPKGVQVSHHNLLNSTRARRQYYRQPVQCFLWQSSFAFDSSVAGLFWTLCDGGTLVIPDDAGAREPLALAALIKAHRVSHLLCIGAFYHALLVHCDGARLRDCLRLVIVAGEACLQPWVETHYRLLPQTQLVNEYGPTEATVWCSAYRCLPSGSIADVPPAVVPIGKAIANTRLYVLDGSLNRLPEQAAGELYIGGDNISRGYLHDSAATSLAYIPDPFATAPGARLYRTGDRVRLNQRGDLEFLGRSDAQIKIRGYRVEVAEIECALQGLPGIERAAVLAEPDRSGRQQLVAYLVATAANPGTIEGWRAELAQRLPDYMLPARFHPVARLPYLPNGKLDKQLLSKTHSGRENMSLLLDRIESLSETEAESLLLTLS